MSPQINRDPSEYNLIRFKSPQAATNIGITRQEEFYPQAGRFLLIESINGPGHIQVKFASSKPWIPVKEGDLLEVEFKGVYFRDCEIPGTAFTPSPVTEVIAYTAWTPLKTSRSIEAGIWPGFATFNGLIATTTPKTLNDYGNTSAFQNRNGPTLVLVKNTDISAVLYISSKGNTDPGPFGVGNYGYPIFPGQEQPLVFTRKIGRYPQSSFVTLTPSQYYDLAFMTDSVSCEFALLISPTSADASDTDVPFGVSL